MNKHISDIGAKRILRAFARMLGFDGIIRVKTSYHMILFYHENYTEVVREKIVDNMSRTTYEIAKFSRYNWSSILNEFASKNIVVPSNVNRRIARYKTYKEYKFASVEELAIKLQLEGYLSA